MLTCAALAAALAQAQPPQTLTLRPGEACPTISIAQVYPKPVRIVADGATVAGLVISGGNVVWSGGTITAPGGTNAPKGIPGYGVFIRGGRNVTIERATITDAVKGLVMNRASDEVTVRNVRFVGALGDGINASGGRLVVTDSLFEFDDRPGGYHQDAIQWFGAELRGPLEISNNVVRGPMQGIGGLGKRPEGVPVTIVNNRIESFAPRAISVKLETGEVRGNIIGDGEMTWTGNIIMGPGIRACGNVPVDFAKSRRPVPDWAKPCK